MKEQEAKRDFEGYDKSKVATFDDIFNDLEGNDEGDGQSDQEQD